MAQATAQAVLPSESLPPLRLSLLNSDCDVGLADDTANGDGHGHRVAGADRFGDLHVHLQYVGAKVWRFPAINDGGGARSSARAFCDCDSRSPGAAAASCRPPTIDDASLAPRARIVILFVAPPHRRRQR